MHMMQTYFFAWFAILYYYDNLLSHLPGLGNLCFWRLYFSLKKTRVLLLYILTVIKALISRL